LQGPLIN